MKTVMGKKSKGVSQSTKKVKIDSRVAAGRDPVVRRDVGGVHLVRGKRFKQLTRSKVLLGKKRKKQMSGMSMEDLQLRDKSGEDNDPLAHTSHVPTSVVPVSPGGTRGWDDGILSSHICNFFCLLSEFFFSFYNTLIFPCADMCSPNAFRMAPAPTARNDSQGNLVPKVQPMVPIP